MIEIDPAAAAHIVGQLAPPSAASRLRGTFSPHADLGSMLLAREILAARGILDWTQTDLAKEARVKVETVRRLEKAEGKPTELTVSRILAAFKRAGVEFFADERRKTIGVRLHWG